VSASANAAEGTFVDALADGGLAAYVADVRSNPGPAVSAIGAAGLRAAVRERAASRPVGPRLQEVRDLCIPGDAPIPARLYRPTAADRPLVVYFHGGGWVFGDLSSHDRACRRLARTADVAVLAVEYRLAPEHPWPAGIEDALTAVRWIRRGDAPVAATMGLAVAGDSSGGTIAALACLWLRDAGEPQPDLQALINPDMDLTLAHPSVETNGHGWGFDIEDARWFAEQWVPDAGRRADPRVSPLFEPDLSGLAPALIVTAEHDLARDEGNAYAAALARAGVPVTHRCERGQVHGFINLDTLSEAAADAGERLWCDIGTLLRANGQPLPAR
jgi:acetyl esterase/lipase